MSESDPQYEPITVIDESTTVHSSEALSGHMMNGWEVVSSDIKTRRWTLKRSRLKRHDDKERDS